MDIKWRNCMKERRETKALSLALVLLILIAGAGTVLNGMASGWNSRENNASSIVTGPRPYMIHNAFFDDVEHGNGSWEPTGFWHIVTNESGAPSWNISYSGAHSWWYGQDSTGNYDNGSRNSGTLTSPTITVTSYPVYLNFMGYYETETNRATPDERRVQISIDNGSYTQLAALSGDPMNTWNHYSYNLTDLFTPYLDYNLPWEKKGVVMSPTLSQESERIAYPYVLKENGTYKMWYSGYDGNTYRILYATSTDGYTWNKHGVVIDTGDGEQRVYSPCVIHEGNTYKMWYTGYNGSVNRILYATSPDGINWTLHGVVMEPDEIDSKGPGHPSILHEGNTYKMWYMASNDTRRGRILYATSTDGTNWTKHGVVMDYGGPYESRGYTRMSVLRMPDGVYRMWYTAQNDDGASNHYRIKAAYSLDGINWTKRDVEINYGDSYSPDGVGFPAVILDNGQLMMWYTGIDWSGDDPMALAITDVTQISHKVKIRFSFDTIDDVENDYKGWYLDDIGVIEIKRPEVASTDPVADTNNVFLGTDVKVIFNTSMDASVVPEIEQVAGSDPGGWTFQGWESTYLPNDTAIWSHDNWSEGDYITLRISGFKDSTGVKGYAYSWSFKTGYLYALSSSPSYQKGHGIQGDVIWYTLQVENTGLLNDTYLLNTSGDSWPVAFYDENMNLIDKVSLSPEEVANISVKVSIPESASLGDMEHMIISVSSENRSSANSNVSIDTYCLHAPTNVAIFQTEDPWDLSSIKDILSDWSIPYTVYGAEDIGVVDLSPYDKVIIVGSDGQDSSLYDAISNNKEWFESYAKHGGIVEIQAADWGDFNDMPFALESDYVSGDNVDVTHPDHPFLTIPNQISGDEMDGWYYSYHRYFTSYPGWAEPVVTEGDTGHSYPILLEFPWGDGRVMVTGQPMTFAWYHGYSRVLENLLLAMDGTALDIPYIVETSPDDMSSSGPQGSFVYYTITVKNRGSSNDTYELNVSGNAWPVNIYDSTGVHIIHRISINSLDSADITVRVKIPYGESPGSHDYVNITVTSINDSNVSAIAQIYTTVTSSTPFLDDVEHGNGSWEPTGFWHIVTNESGAPSWNISYSGAHSWWYGQDSTGNYDNGSRNSGTLTSPTITVTSYPVYLNFMGYYETETNRATPDERRVQISIDNGSYTQLAALSGDPMNTWNHYSYNLTDLLSPYLDYDLPWNKEGEVMPATLSQESEKVIFPFVLKENGTYKMWYSGYDGSNYRILYATSTDGYVWDKHGVVLDIGGSGEDQRVFGPCVIHEGNTYKMWYTGNGGDVNRIFYATSPDGINWTKHGIVLEPGDDGIDSGGLSYPKVIKDGGIYKMWYTAGNDTRYGRVFYATSTDGTNWTKHGIVMDYGAPYENKGISEISILKMPDGVYRMWYTSRYNNDGSNRYVIKAAYSMDGTNWTKRNVEINYGESYAPDGAGFPAVILDNGQLMMWYTGVDWSGDEIIDLATTDVTQISHTVKIRFSFDTKDASDNDHQGWYIDDIFIGNPADLDREPPEFQGINGIRNMGDGTSLRLSWSPASDESAPILYYIYRSTSPGAENFSYPIGSTNTTYFIDTGLETGRTYYYVVRAEDSRGNMDDNTVEMSAVPKVQWYLQVESSAVSGYRNLTNLNVNYLDAGYLESSGELNSTGQYRTGEGWLSQALSDEVTTYGEWDFSIYGHISSPDKAHGTLYAKVYRYNAGSPILLFEAEDDEDISSFHSAHLFQWTYNAPSITVPSGDRILVEIWLNVTDISADSSSEYGYGSGDNLAYYCDVDTYPPEGANLNSKTELSAQEYSEISSSDDTEYASPNPGPGDKVFMWFEMEVAENPDTISQMNFTFEGHPSKDATLYIYLYNFSSDSWESNELKVKDYSTSDSVMKGLLTGGFTNYINSTGVVRWAVYSETSNTSLYVDHVSMSVVSTGFSTFYLDYDSEDTDSSIFPSVNPVTNMLNISVHQGWNLITLPWQVNPVSITDALHGISWDRAMIYINGQWYTYDRNRPSRFNIGFPKVDNTVGIWVNCTSEGTISGPGGDLGNTTLHLKKGWNLVGYPSGNDRKVSDALNGVPWVYLETADSTGNIRALGSSDYLVVGNAYWIYVDQDWDWTVQW